MVIDAAQGPEAEESELPNSLPQRDLKGSLHLSWKRCGKPNCRCRTGSLHGPYYYRRWRDAGRQKKEYIPRDQVPSVLLAIKARRQAAHDIARLKAALTRPRQDPI